MFLVAEGSAVVQAASDGLGVAEWAGIIGAGAAAVAAIASLASVLQNRRIITTTLRPKLTGVVVQDQARPVLQVHNSGGTVAIAPRVLWAHRDQFIEEDLGGGISSGGEVVIVSALANEGLAESHGAMTCVDGSGNFYADSLDGDHDDWKRKRWWRRKVLERPNIHEVYREFYGSATDGFQRVDARFARRMSDALVIEPFPEA